MANSEPTKPRPDPFSGVFRWAWHRTYESANKLLFGGIAFAVLGGGTNLALSGWPKGKSVEVHAVNLIVGALVGTLAAIGFIYVIALVLAPYGQRKALRAAVVALGQPQEGVRAFDVAVYSGRFPEPRTELRSDSSLWDGNLWCIGLVNNGPTVELTAYIDMTMGGAVWPGYPSRPVLWRGASSGPYQVAQNLSALMEAVFIAPMAFDPVEDDDEDEIHALIKIVNSNGNYVTTWKESTDLWADREDVGLRLTLVHPDHPSPKHFYFQIRKHFARGKFIYWTVRDDGEPDDE